jgi:hypothetical protein
VPVTVRDTSTLARSGEREYPLCNVHGDAPDVLPAPFDFAGMNPGPNVDSDGPDALDDALGAAHGATGAVERGEDAVAGVLHQPPAVP